MDDVIAEWSARIETTDFNKFSFAYNLSLSEKGLLC